MRTICVLFAVILILSGCASKLIVSSDVTRFNDFKRETTQPKTFAFTSASSSLEDATYRTLIENALSELGWKQITKDKAAYLVSYSAKIDSGTAFNASSSILGVTGGGVSTTSGTVSGPVGGTANYVGTTTTPLSIGVVGVDNSTVMRYRRDLKVIIRNASTGRPVFEGNAWNRGPSSSLSEIMPFLVQALFYEFPGLNGVNNLYGVEIDKNGRTIGSVKRYR